MSMSARIQWQSTNNYLSRFVVCDMSCTDKRAILADIDECMDNVDSCNDASAQCDNYVGGYECRCAVGYRLSNEGVCIGK